MSNVQIDALSMAHVRVRQSFGGVAVFGGEAIVHFSSAGELFGETNSLVSNLNVDPRPQITPAKAIEKATEDYGCATCLTGPPAADLWVIRHEGKDRLAYRVRMRRVDGSSRTALPVAFIDAHDGQVVWRYDDLQTGPGAPDVKTGVGGTRP